MLNMFFVISNVLCVLICLCRFAIFPCDIAAEQPLEPTLSLLPDPAPALYVSASGQFSILVIQTLQTKQKGLMIYFFPNPDSSQFFPWKMYRCKVL